MANSKEFLIEKISSIKDQSILDYLSEMLRLVDNEGTFNLTQNIKNDLDKSIDQIKNGEFLTHDQVMVAWTRKK